MISPMEPAAVAADADTTVQADTTVVSIAGIRDAAARISLHVNKTPVLTCNALDEMSGGRQLFFKCELFQKTGSFKARGACNAVLQAPAECRDIVTHSSGNHAQARAGLDMIFGTIYLFSKLVFVFEQDTSWIPCRAYCIRTNDNFKHESYHIFKSNNFTRNEMRTQRGGKGLTTRTLRKFVRSIQEDRNISTM